MLYFHSNLTSKLQRKRHQVPAPKQCQAELDNYVKKFRKALNHEKAAKHLHAEAQQVQDHMTYLVTICGIKLRTTNLHLGLLQLTQLRKN